MSSTEIFTMALGLQSPWYIEKIEFQPVDKQVRELHIYINFERGTKFKLPDSEELCDAYDTEDKQWQHLNFFEHKSYLHARVPRVENSAGKVRVIEVPWARPGSGFTMLFDAYAMLLIENEMPVRKAARCIGITPHRLWRIFNYWINRARKKEDLSKVSRIGVDETSRKKGHHYITQFVDLDTRRTIFACEGKDSATVAAFTKELEAKGGDKSNISIVSMDMSPAFISGADECLPNAQIVFDKFHLVQMLNTAMDELRRLERNGNELLKGQRYSLLHLYKNLSIEKKEMVDKLQYLYPKIGEAYRLKELFMDVFEIKDVEEAKGFLWFWCGLAVDSGIQPFIRFVNTVKAHWSGIVAYFDNGVTNGILEGINSKIQLAKRRARGYRNPQNFINMIYLIAGKLKLEYQFYPLKTT
jgi:transposase